MRRLGVPVNPWRGYRLSDDYGLGNFGATRGARLHMGQDYRADPGDDGLAMLDGVVRRTFLCYKDSTILRGILIEGSGEYDGIMQESMYVKPDVKVGDRVKLLECIGIVQDVAAYYKAKNPTRDMINHIHVTVWVADDPRRYVVEPPPEPIVA